ncbi:MAG: NAD(P)-dependent oxidoreductase [Chitinophagales bacterium]|jgi:alanine dehydrogenase|nr:NAD(P)-dependent oxidoreductase [Chitinophagales bacterium]
MKKFLVGILREEKYPLDNRVALSPSTCKSLREKYSFLSFRIQQATHRCFDIQEYIDAGVEVNEDLSVCDLLVGIKEVPVEHLINNARYLFFSHTAKKQKNNLKLLQEFIRKKIEIIDYEYLRDQNNKRIIAFGRFAGLVGAYNAIWAWHQREYKKDIPRIYLSEDKFQTLRNIADIKFKPIKILVTGSGNVAQGCWEVMEMANITQVSPDDILYYTYDYPVYARFSSKDMFEHKLNKPFDAQDFYEKPLNYKSKFTSYLNAADMLINAMYWQQNYPKILTLKEMKSKDFNLKIISDITCDLAPNSSLDSTIKFTHIENPIFGYLPLREKIVPPFSKGVIDILSISNLPSEMPREASEYFSQIMEYKILPEFFKEQSEMIDNATITKNGKLTREFSHLESYVFDDDFIANS